RVLIGPHPVDAGRQVLGTFENDDVAFLADGVEEVARSRERELVVVGAYISDDITAGEPLVYVGHRDAGGIELVDRGHHRLGIEWREHDGVGLDAHDLVNEAELLGGVFASRNEMDDFGVERPRRRLAADAHPAKNGIGRIAGEGGDGLGAGRERWHHAERRDHRRETKAAGYPAGFLPEQKGHPGSPCDWVENGRGAARAPPLPCPQRCSITSRADPVEAGSARPWVSCPCRLRSAKACDRRSRSTSRGPPSRSSV